MTPQQRFEVALATKPGDVWRRRYDTRRGSALLRIEEGNGGKFRVPIRYSSTRTGWITFVVLAENYVKVDTAIEFEERIKRARTIAGF